MSLPKLVIAADWSVNPAKRRWVSAERTIDGKFLVSAPTPVGDLKDFWASVRSGLSPSDGVLVGFDFPIGLPAEYAKATGPNAFREALRGFGTGDWENFYKLSDAPAWRQPFSPSDYKLPKSKSRLIAALGGTANGIKRNCDRNSGAESLFFTTGAKQVGRGAIVGWRDVLAPQLERLKIWPFDGPLDQLLSSGGTTIVEIYPRQAYKDLDLRIGISGARKTEKEHRRLALSKLSLNWPFERIVLDTEAAIELSEGFKSEDDFDAFAGLISMLIVLDHGRTGEPRHDMDVLNMEGWIFGLQPKATLR
jgi:hypothetical protein